MKTWHADKGITSMQVGVAIALTFWTEAERAVPEDAFEIAP